MAGTSLKGFVLGFVAGALAAVSVQEAIAYGLAECEVLATTPWDTTPWGAYGLPWLAVSAIVGGVWGIVFSLILGDPPSGSMTLRGILLGILGPGVLGSLVVGPLLRAEPVFFGGDIGHAGALVLIAAGFGAVTAWLYGFLTSGCRLP